jgi:plastocyanin
MKKTVSILLAVVCMSVFAVSTVCAEEQKKIVKEKAIAAHKVIRLHYIGGINPSEITIKPGTTVIWMNDSRAAVELQFQGKQVTMACKSPVHFVVDENGSFISDRIPQGSVASLCFVEKGEFPYVARKAATGATYEHRGAIKEFTGKVIVE